MARSKSAKLGRQTRSSMGGGVRRGWSRSRATAANPMLPFVPAEKNLGRFIVVAYDISNDKRRTRLHKALRRFGEPVQKSVFECLLNNELNKEMRKRAGSICQNPEIELRYYELCAACRKKVRSLGCGETTTIKRAYVL